MKYIENVNTYFFPSVFIFQQKMFFRMYLKTVNLLALHSIPMSSEQTNLYIFMFPKNIFIMYYVSVTTPILRNRVNLVIHFTFQKRKVVKSISVILIPNIILRMNPTPKLTYNSFKSFYQKILQLRCKTIIRILNRNFYVECFITYLYFTRNKYCVNFQLI